MTDHSDSKNQPGSIEDIPDYLLDDDELAASLSKEFEAAQKSGSLPDDSLRLQRNWRELKSKLPAESKQKIKKSFVSRWTPLLSVVAAAVLIMLVWPPGAEKGSDLANPAIFKGGENVGEPLSYPKLKLSKVEDGVWEVDIIMVAEGSSQEFDQSIFLSVLAGPSDAEGGQASLAKVFWQGASTDWTGKKQLRAKSLGLSESNIKVCLLTGDSQATLEQKVSITLENFAILQLSQCVNAL